MNNPKPYRAKSLSGAQAYVRALLKRIEKDDRLLTQFDQQRKMLAKLAAKGPTFFNPLEAMAAENLRDELLKDMGLAPDGSVLNRLAVSHD